MDIIIRKEIKGHEDGPDGWHQWKETEIKCFISNSSPGRLKTVHLNVGTWKERGSVSKQQRAVEWKQRIELGPTDANRSGTENLLEEFQEKYCRVNGFEIIKLGMILSPNCGSVLASPFSELTAFLRGVIYYFYIRPPTHTITTVQKKVRFSTGMLNKSDRRQLHRAIV